MITPNDDVRRIRQLLTAILVCMVILVFAVVPGLLPAALLALIVYGVLMIAFGTSQHARNKAIESWNQVSSWWRR